MEDGEEEEDGINPECRRKQAPFCNGHVAIDKGWHKNGKELLWNKQVYQWV